MEASLEFPIHFLKIYSWTNRDEAYANVAQGVRQAVEAMLRPTLPGETAAGTVASESAMVPHVQAAPMRILHLSDLHFDKDDDPLARLQPLLRDIRDRDGGLGFEHLDYLILSGDLTNHGSAEEFDGVYRFVSELIKRFELSAGRCVIVPGNHDLSWETEVYDWHPKRRVVLNTAEAGQLRGAGRWVSHPRRECLSQAVRELRQVLSRVDPTAVSTPTCCAMRTDFV